MQPVDPWVWWYRTVALWSIGCNLIIGVVLCNPAIQRLYSTPSMHVIRRWSLPWPAWGALFIAAALFLIPTRTRSIGYLLGFVLCGFFAGYCLIYSLFEGHIGNIVISLLATQAALTQIGGLRYWVIIRSRPAKIAALLDGAR